MKLTRFFCFALALLLLESAVCFASGTAKAKITLDFNEPYVLCDVGETVDFSAYQVVFEGSFTAQSDPVWKNAQGQVCSSFVPEKAGVAQFQVSSGEKTMPMFVVSKNPDDEEYVLFELDFSEYSSLDELQALGFRFDLHEERYRLNGTALEMGDVDADYTQLLLPEWLTAFDNTAFSVEAKMLESKNDRRWFSLFVRAQNEGYTRSPYYHFCIRENTLVDNGVEFAQQAKDGRWSVFSKNYGPIASLKTDYHNFTVESYGLDFRCSIDENELLSVTRSSLNLQKNNLRSGALGVTVNCGRMALKSLRVTLQESDPKFSELKIPLLINPHEPTNLKNAVANVKRINQNVLLTLDEPETVGSCLFAADADINLAKALELCREKRIVPTVQVRNEQEANSLLFAVEQTAFTDLNAVSDDAKLLRLLHDADPDIRTGLMVSVPKGEFDSKAANELRKSIRSAPATFCILKGEEATRKVVSELQKLAVSVWVSVDAPTDSDDFAADVIRALTTGAHGVITDSSKTANDVLNRCFVNNTMTRTPLIIGHRAAPNLAPENSLSGCLAAYESGADAIEIDLALTADGEVILLHDATLNRTTNYEGEKSVSEMTLAEIREYRLLDQSGTVTQESVPTLREVLEALRGKDCVFLIEFKESCGNTIEGAAKIIQELDMEDQINAISFSTEFVKEIQERLPGVSVGHLTSIPSTSNTQSGSLFTLSELLTDAQAHEGTVHLTKVSFTALFQQSATDRGQTVWPFTYHASDNTHAFLGVCDGITTDDPQWAKNMAQTLVCNNPTTSLMGGESLQADVHYLSYGHQTVKVDASELLCTVLSGEELLTVEQGTLTAKSGPGGEATVLFGYRTETNGGREYVLYTEPLTVYVNASEEAASSTWLWIVGGAGLAVLCAAGTLLVLRARKNKKQ